MKAAGRGDLKTVDRLVAEGVDVNTQGYKSITPLFWTLSRGNRKGYLHLLELGADPNDRWEDGYPLMLLIAHVEDPFYLEEALKHGGDPNIEDPGNKQTPISETFELGPKTKLQLLIKHGADVNHQDKHGDTPMMLAAGGSAAYDAVWMLLKAGADPTIKNVWGNDLSYDINTHEKTGLKPEIQPWFEKVKKILVEKWGYKF